MDKLTTKETILVVDDTESVLKVVVAILKRDNFNVLQASTGASAIDLAQNYVGTIHLILSDVQMPGMTGPDLGTAIKKTRPDVHVMLMSGFPGGNLLVLNYGWSFIEKPFVPAKLLEMVTDVLHTPNKAQDANQYDIRKDADPNKKVEAGQVPMPAAK